MKSSRTLIFASAFTVVLILGLVVRFLPLIENSGPLIVEISIPKGDAVPDMRTPDEACTPYLANVQADHNDWVCSLSEAVNVEPTEEDSIALCVDGMSVAGCFACTFTCEAPVAAQ